ncbi:flagellar hook-length control protein FliK [Collimonas sp. H4R21]|uniref:Flagellar hook-length control protein FliK n=1 Tax=Collimonas rhizosphaerae TaxID=3126357 RepID=A0ABU9Q0Z4_9BURK
MSLPVSSSTAALQAVPPNGSAAGNANPQQNGADHFGKVLDRSLASAGQPAEKIADKASAGAKPAERTAPRRQAGTDKEQDPGAVPALAFLALPPAGAKAIEARPESGSGSQPKSAAEEQLNAAIAAAGGKPATSAVVAAAVAENPGKNAIPTAAAPPAVAQLATPAGPVEAAPTRPSASARKETTSGEYTPLAHNPQPLASQAGAADAAGQQATQDDAHTDQHGKLEKAERKDSLDAAKIASGPAQANANTNASEIATAKAAAGSGGQPGLAVTAQANPALAHTPSAVTAADTAAPPAVKLALSPAVGSDGWGAALGKQVVWMGNTRNQSAELHLNPPDLGPLKVTLTINDNQAQATFVSAHQSVRTALEAALPQLRSSLAESGISLGNTSVSSDAQQPQQQQQGTFAQHQGSQRGSGSPFQAGVAAGELAAKVERSTAAAGRNGNGKVDIFA